LGTCWDVENDGKFFWEHWEHTTFSSWDLLWECQAERIDQGNDGKISYEYGELKKERPEHLKRELKSVGVSTCTSSHTFSSLCSNVRIEVWKLHLELPLYNHLVVLLDNFGILFFWAMNY
jgi:hypothetical protein